MAAAVIIPARFASTRFPGKIVAASTGRPLVQHVVDQVRRCRAVAQVIVATDDERIVAALAPFGTDCRMTSPHHVSGTDRVAEVARSLGDEVRVIVNVQGDEPEIEPETVDALIGRIERGEEAMATAATPFPPEADVNDPNLVKVVTDRRGRALYFSRSAIPFVRDSADKTRVAYYLHQGIYAFARDFLQTFAAWPSTQLEQSEKLEQLRALEYGASIAVLETARVVHGIDTPQQYEAFVRRYNEQVLSVAR